MSKAEYNGWTNYETWVVNLWISNDESTLNYWRLRAMCCARDARADKVWTEAECAKFTLADQLKDEFETASQGILSTSILNLTVGVYAKAQSSVWADLLGAALSEVNWGEIAEHLIGSAREIQEQRH